MSKEEFVQQAYEAARQSSARSGMPPLVTVAQAALESSWGHSELSREGNNYFGIKAHGSHERIAMSTVEFRKGERLVVQAEFARYKSLLDCFECRDGILLRGASYAKARAARGNEDEFIREIAVHWATDPRYAEKLEAVLREVKGMLA